MFRLKMLVIGALCVSCGDRNTSHAESTDVLPDIIVDSRDTNNVPAMIEYEIAGGTHEPVRECVGEVAMDIGKWALEAAGSVQPIQEAAKSTKTNVELVDKGKTSLLSGNRAVAQPRVSIQHVNVPAPSLPRSKPPLRVPTDSFAPTVPPGGQGKPLDIGKRGRLYVPDNGRAGIGIRF